MAVPGSVLGKPITCVWPSLFSLWEAVFLGNYALCCGGNQEEKWVLGTEPSLLDGLAWRWVKEGPVSYGDPQVCGQPVICFCILLVPTAPPCFREA